MDNLGSSVPGHSMRTATDDGTFDSGISLLWLQTRASGSEMVSAKVLLLFCLGCIYCDANGQHHLLEAFDFHISDCELTCEPCVACLAADPLTPSYDCSLPGLESLIPGGYAGVTANYLSFETEKSSGYFPLRAAQFEACTGGKILFSEATNVFENAVQDLGTKTSRGTELYDGYLMSYSHFPEVSKLGLAEHLNDRIRKDNARLKYEDMLSQVRKMGEYRTAEATNVDFLMFDGDFFVPIIRLDLLERHNLALPNTWEELVKYAKFFNGTDLNEDGDANDFGFCHFPRVGAGSWDWWFSEAVYSTFATTDQTHGSQQGFFFDEDTMEPRFGDGFLHAAEIWKDLWTFGSDSESDVFMTGRCAIGFGPPGGWKKVFLGEVSRKDTNGTVIWRPTMNSGKYAEPYRFKPFGSTKVVDRTTGRMETCTPSLCPKAELVPPRGHHGDGDRASVLPASPLQGQLINRAPFYWSGGLGTLIRKSSPTVKKDLLWDFFVYINSPDTSIHDVASYSSWIDSWRHSQLSPGNNFLNAGWSQDAYQEHTSIMHWALSNEVNGALNLRIPGMAKYTRDAIGESMHKYIRGQISSLNDLEKEVADGWRAITKQEGKLDQLEVYRASLGLIAHSEVELCRLHRGLMDDRDPSICRQYDDYVASKRVHLAAVLVPVTFFVIAIAIFVHFRLKRKSADSVWKIASNDLEFNEPAELLGNGMFGPVLLAEYRGTEVAVKRLLPSRTDYSVSHDLESCLDIKPVVQTDSTTVNVTSGEMSDGGRSLPIPLKAKLTRVEESKAMQTGAGNATISTDCRSSSGYPSSITRLKANFIVDMRQLSKLRHPCITTVVGAVIEKREQPLLVMEYMSHGSLRDILHNETMHLEGDLILSISRDITQGMRFLHAATPAVIHGDLTTMNVLVDNRFRSKISNFGLSAKKRSFGTVGSPFWMAPELLRGDSGITAASDVYAFGIVLYEIFSRKDPYDGEDPDQVLEEVADTQINKRPPVPKTCPADFASIMADCVGGEADLRPTFEELNLRMKRLHANNIPSTQASRNLDLLHKVFPKHIAAALRDGRVVEPDKKECVSIFFSDICGFTNISAILSDIQVSDMLDRLYLRFDELASASDVFKMETIGDAYMGVTNLVADQSYDHVKIIAKFALDAMQAASETLINLDDPSMGYVQMRGGFHCGPVIARVVGSLNPKYSMFGDAVNVAARMESNSLPGLVQCSERAARLLSQQCPDMPIYSRGSIAIKGKGEMRTYFVGPNDDSTYPDARPLLLRNSSTRSKATENGKPLPSSRAGSVRDMFGL